MKGSRDSERPGRSKTGSTHNTRLPKSSKKVYFSVDGDIVQAYSVEINSDAASSVMGGDVYGCDKYALPTASPFRQTLLKRLTW
jgi:hypothetical protein